MNQSMQAQVTLERIDDEVRGNLSTDEFVLFGAKAKPINFSFLCTSVSDALDRTLSEHESIHIQSMLGTPGEHSVRKLVIGPGAKLRSEVWGAEGR